VCVCVVSGVILKTVYTSESTEEVKDTRRIYLQPSDQISDLLSLPPFSFPSSVRPAVVRDEGTGERDREGVRLCFRSVITCCRVAPLCLSLDKGFTALVCMCVKHSQVCKGILSQWFGFEAIEV